MVKGLDWFRNKWMLVKEIMARNPELLSLFFALVLSGIVSHLDNPKGSKATPYVIPIPPKIFDHESPVIEFTTGDMTAVRNVIASTGAEVWIIMYYAHWDAYSLETAKEFERTAEKMSDQVLFMAVNCWYPYGACRHKVTVPYFPILFTHRDSREGIQYTGLQRAPEMVDHLKRVCSPLKVVQDLESLRLLRAQHDAVALAYFSFEGTLAPQGLASYQWAAMQHLEKDPVQPTPFAIITNKQLARTLGLTNSMNITLLRNFNVSLYYPSSREFKAKPIVEFVTAHRESMVQWIASPGLKSTILSSHIFTRPTIIVFTPHRHDQVFANYFMMLREATLEYYNCANSSYILTLQKVIREERKKYASQSPDSDSSCAPTSNEECMDNASSRESDCCQTLASRGRIESISRARGNVCEICETFSQPLQPSSDPCTYLTLSSGSSLLLDATNGVTASSNACLYLSNFYSPFSHYRLCCQDVDLLTCDLCSTFHSSVHKHSLSSGSMHSHRSRTFDSHLAPKHKECDCSKKYQRLSGDPLDSFTVVDSLTASSSEDDNKQSCHTKSSRTTVYNNQENDFDATSESLQKKFEHLGCRTNKTLVFRAMRSEYFWQMADRLGIKPQSQHKNSSVGVAIIDIQSETHHILPLDESGLSLPLLKQFIVNYTESLLPRHRHSTSPSSTCTKASDSICITEVADDTYEDMVLNTAKDVLLLYYAPWCGACLRIQHLYLQLASLFRSHDSLRIARINGDLNDLHWHLLTPAYPTILFFPGHNKARSVKFPEESAITLPNLVDFVLKHSR